jgi:hypothetical protein
VNGWTLTVKGFAVIVRSCLGFNAVFC